MVREVDAIYEGGVLRPLQALDGFAEKERVRVTVTSSASPANGLQDCIGTLPDDDAQELRAIIEREFETVNPSEW